MLPNTLQYANNPLSTDPYKVSTYGGVGSGGINITPMQGRAVSTYISHPQYHQQAPRVEARSTYNPALAKVSQAPQSGYVSNYIPVGGSGKISTYTAMPELAGATTEIGNLIKKLEDERQHRVAREREIEGLYREISDLKDENIDRFNAIEELKAINETLTHELTRLASSIGGHYDNQNNRILTREEMILDSVI